MSRRRTGRAGVALGAVAVGVLAVVAPVPAAAGVAATVHTVRLVTGEYQVYVGGVASAAVAVSDPAYEVRATVSPDARTAAVIVDFDGQAGSSLRLLDVTGTVAGAGTARTVADGRVTSAVFAQDGTLGYVDDGRLFTMAAGGTARAVGAVDADAAPELLGWTDDAAGLLVQHRGGEAMAASLSRVDVATGKRTAVLASDPAAGVVYRDFRIARVDGRQRISAVRATHVYPCAGTGSALVLADERGAVLRTLGETTDSYRAATWSTDGRRVTYELQGCVAQRDKPLGPGRLDAVNGVYVLDRGTGQAHRVVRGLSSAFRLADASGMDTVRLASSRFGVRELAADTVDRVAADTVDLVAADTAATQRSAVQRKVIPSTFIHQLWDTADDFNGNSACGPTSAVMDLAGYQLSDQFRVWASSPYGHWSPYGGYISKEYSAYGTTYDDYAPDPNWNYFAGAYGWLVEDPDEGTLHKWMTDYLDRHVSYPVARASAPSAAWIRARIDANLMVVVSGNFAYGAYGHIGLITGYTDDGRFYVNDPYGAGTDGSYDGKNTIYTLDYMRGWAFWAA